MTTGVLITLIICGTILLLVLIGWIRTEINRKRTSKAVDKVADSFKDLFKED